MPKPRYIKNVRSESDRGMEDFPEDFDNDYFHNEVVQNDKKIRSLRTIVYNKINDAIHERIASYKNLPAIALEDSLTVTFNTDGFTTFQFAVIREELMQLDFVAEFEDLIDLSKFNVTISRNIKLSGPLPDCSDSEDSDSEDSESGELENPDGLD